MQTSNASLNNGTAPQDAISKSELALLVLYYLKDQGFSTLHQEFQNECEARKLIANMKIVPIKGLQDVLEEYISLKQQQLEREALLHNFDSKLHPQNAHLANYTLQSIVTLLEVFNQNFKFNTNSKSMALGFPAPSAVSQPVPSTLNPPIPSIPMPSAIKPNPTTAFNASKESVSSSTTAIPPQSLPNSVVSSKIQKEEISSTSIPPNGAPLKTVLEMTHNANKTNTLWHITTFDSKPTTAASSSSSTADSKSKSKKDKLKKNQIKPPQVSEARKAQLEKNSKKKDPKIEIKEDDLNFLKNYVSKDKYPSSSSSSLPFPDLLSSHANTGVVDLSTPPSNKTSKQDASSTAIMRSPYAQKLINSMMSDNRLIKKLTDTINNTLTQSDPNTVEGNAVVDSAIIPSEEEVKQASGSQLQQQQLNEKAEEKQQTPTKNQQHNTSDPFLSPKQVDTILTRLDDDVDEYLGLLDDADGNFFFDELLNSDPTTAPTTVNLSPIPFTESDLQPSTNHNSSSSSANSSISQCSTDSITGVSVINMFTSPISSSKRKNTAVKRMQPESFFSSSRASKHKRGSGDLEFGSPSFLQGLDLRNTPVEKASTVPPSTLPTNANNSSTFLESILDRRDKSEAAIPITLNLSDSFSEDDQSRHSQQQQQSTNTGASADAIDDFLNKMNYTNA